MLKYVVNICLISFFVIHLINAEAVKQNRRVKRLGTGGRNATNKFKKEIWKQDVGDLFQIEPSTQGTQNVHLKCGSNSMFVKLETDSEFTGVMYTKGNFYDQSEPCFVSTKTKRGTRNLSMRFTFEQCNTKYDGNVFTNTIVVQNDPELVTPGDAAFSLIMASGARITLTSPDPSSNNAPPDTDNIIFSETDTDSVIFNAHDKQTATDDASSASLESHETDESASSVHDHPQKVKITIDSVAPYAINNEEMQSTNIVDDIDESENTIEHTNEIDEETGEKRVKNDEL